MTSIRANGTNQADWPTGIYISAGCASLPIVANLKREWKPEVLEAHLEAANDSVKSILNSLQTSEERVSIPHI